MEQHPYKTIETCRIFPNEKLETFFDLGLQPPANSLRKNLNERVFEAPLALAWGEKSQSVQLTVNVDSKFLFEDYVWVTGTSSTAREYAEVFADRLLARVNKPAPFIVEVASNDGTFLKPLIQRGAKVVGVDPAKNIAAEANRAGVETFADFFNPASAEMVQAKYGKCDALFARNVIPHIEHVNDVLQGVVNLLSHDGVGAFEFHYAGKILSELHYDSIYHEHLFYHSIASMNHLLAKFGFNSYDITESPISGGSYVIYFSREKKTHTAAYTTALQKEEQSGITRKETWVRFAEQSARHAKALKAAVEKEVQAGRKVIGYGASARSSTMLNYAGIDSKLLTCIADKSPYKHNRFTAGTDIKIISPEEALATKPDTVLLLAWNFEKEIISELKAAGFKGKVIVPLPEPIREVMLG